MAKIYISSTFSDLKDCRDAAIKLLRRMRHDVVAMEDYTAEDQWPADKCLADVAACDLYVGLFAWRYGYISADNNPGQLSITEMEYRQAIESKKHCLIFLLKEDAPWPRPLMDRNPDRIEDFRTRLGSTHTCDFFASAQDVAGLVSTAVANWVRTQGMGGFGGHTAFDLDAYFTAMSKFYQRLELEGLTQPQREQHLLMQLSNIFVEPSVREDRPPVELTKEAWDRLRREREVRDDDLPLREFGLPHEELRRTRELYFEKPKRLVLEVLTDPRYRHAIVLGDPGSGKSTLARYALLSLIGPPYVLEADDKLRQAFPDYLPLLIELRSFAALRAEGKCDTFLEFLDYLGKTEGRGLDKDALHEYLKHDGRAVVIFDGLDEIFDPADRETIARQIVGFAAHYPKVRILATSRIVGFPQKVMENGGFTVFTLQDLDEAQVEAFIGRWYALALLDRPAEAAERCQRILRSFGESTSIRQLAGNPMLLTIMAIIGKHQELPRERWKLYDHAASVLIEHWDINKHLRDHRLLDHGDFLGEGEKKELLRRLAHRMQRGDGGLAGNFIHKTELEAEFEEYLKDRFGKSPADATAIARLLIQQFRDRNFILCFRGAGSFGFVHRAFLEFFCASSFVFQFEKTQELSLDDLKEVFAAHWDAREWREPLRLICGMINEKFAGDVIDSLLEEPRQPREFEYDRLPPWHIALAVQCLSELNSMDQITDTAERVLKGICELLNAVSRLESNLELESFYEFLDAEVASASKNVGSNWPSCDWLVEWLDNYKTFFVPETFAKTFGSIIGSAGARQNAMLRKILDGFDKPDDEFRYLLAHVLVIGWGKDKQTATLLHKLALHDQYGWVRNAALIALATNFRDAEGTLEMLRDRALNDPDGYARSAALSALATNFRAAEGTLEMLRDRALNDPDGYARGEALSALATNFHAAEGTLEMLRDRALNDPVWNARSAALSALATNFRDAEGTLEMLRDRALNDPVWNTRSGALGALASNFRDAEGTLEMLRDRALNDPEGYARSAALSALASNFRDAEGTLEMLRDRALNDPVWNTRSGALGALASNFRAAEGTLEMLRDRALNDPEGNARSAALSALASNFRNAEGTLEMLRDRALNDPEGYARGEALSALASNFRNAEGTLEMLRDRALNDPVWNARSAALSALASNFRDAEGTLEMLRDRALNDPVWNARSGALGALASNFRAAEGTLEMLRDRALNDPEGNARGDTLSALATNFRAAEGTLEMLRDRALNDPEGNARSAALSALASNFRNAEGTLEMLRDRALNDPEGYARGEALSALASNFRAAEGTLEMLRDRALNDPDGYARGSALSALATNFHVAEGTLEMLRDRAINDHAWNARGSALSALATNFRDAEGTLEMLRDRALNDPEGNARGSALDVLASNFRNGERTLEMLRDRALNDPEGNARGDTLSVLATNFRAAEGTLEMLRDRAINDPEGSARGSALSALASNFRNAEGTLEMLRDRALNDPEGDARGSALSALASNFRAAEGTLEMLRDRALNDPEGNARGFALWALASDFRAAEGTLEMLRDRALNDPEGNARGFALWALASNFRNAEGTLEMLRDRALNDPEGNARGDTLSALASNFRNTEGTLELLRDRALNDPEGNARGCALGALASNFRNAEGTLEMLRDRAINDPEGSARGSALSALASNFRNAEGTLEMLRDCALNDPEGNARGSALGALALNFRDAEGTLEMLRDRAVKDKSPKAKDKDKDKDKDTDYETYPRQAALEAIARYWPQHPDTLPLLRERAQKEKTPWLKERALELAAELEKRSQVDAKNADTSDEERKSHG